MWSDEWFQDPVLLREEGQLASPDIAPPSVKDSQSSLEGKGETLTLIGDSVAQESSGRSRRKVPVARPTTLTAMYHELLKPRPDPHSLIKPMAHGVPLDEGADPPIIAQPFAVKVHPQVAFICDAHAHMCESEVIGLLAGRWDAEQKVLYVQAPFPMTATDRHDDGSTDVELDPIAELEVREIIARLDMVVVGWYHSHPKFRPDPSITDIFNQSQYQHLMRDELSGLEPFVGLIVSTFDAMRPTSRSIHKWFHSVPYDNEGNFKRPVNIPFEITVHQREYSTQHLPFSRYLDNHNLTQHFESILATGSYCSLEALEGTDGPHRDSKGTSGAASPEASGPSIECNSNLMDCL